MGNQSVVTRGGGSRGVAVMGQHTRFLRGVGLFCSLVAMGLTQIYPCVKILQLYTPKCLLSGMLIIEMINY